MFVPARDALTAAKCLIQPGTPLLPVDAAAVGRIRIGFDIGVGNDLVTFWKKKVATASSGQHCETCEDRALEHCATGCSSSRTPQSLVQTLIYKGRISCGIAQSSRPGWEAKRCDDTRNHTASNEKCTGSCACVWRVCLAAGWMGGHLQSLASPTPDACMSQGMVLGQDGYVGLLAVNTVSDG